MLVGSARFERATCRLGGGCSIQLSYEPTYQGTSEGRKVRCKTWPGARRALFYRRQKRAIADTASAGIHGIRCVGLLE